MADILPGDGALEKFINNNSDDKNFPTELAMILIALKEKMVYVTEIYKATMDTYLKLDSKDPLKEILKGQIIQLSKYTTGAIDQFDYVLMNDECDHEKHEKPEDPGIIEDGDI